MRNCHRNTLKSACFKEKRKTFPSHIKNSFEKHEKVIQSLLIISREILGKLFFPEYKISNDFMLT